MIRADGQLEAFEENIFLHFLLLNLENSWLMQSSVLRFNPAKLGRKSLLRPQMDLGNALIK